MPVKGHREELMYNEVTMFRHSPDSWTQMWVEDVFGGEGRVKVDTELVSILRKKLPDYSEERIWNLNWSVTRL